MKLHWQRWSQAGHYRLVDPSRGLNKGWDEAVGWVSAKAGPDGRYEATAVDGSRHVGFHQRKLMKKVKKIYKDQQLHYLEEFLKRD